MTMVVEGPSRFVVNRSWIEVDSCRRNSVPLGASFAPKFG